MDINEAIKITNRSKSLLGARIIADDEYYKVKGYVAKGYVEAYNSQQKIIDKQREEIESLTKQVKDLKSNTDDPYGLVDEL
jgi:cell division protein FtsB